jgi:hypothetical protein
VKISAVKSGRNIFIQARFDKTKLIQFRQLIISPRIAFSSRDGHATPLPLRLKPPLPFVDAGGQDSYIAGDSAASRTPSSALQ